METILRFALVCCFLFSAIVSSGQSKLSEDLSREVAESTSEYLNVLIFLNEKAELASFANRSKREKRIGVVNSLQTVAKSSQIDLLTTLEKLQQRGDVIDFRSFWVINAVRAQVKSSAILEIEKVSNVEEIDIYPEFEVLSSSNRKPTEIESSLLSGSSQPNHQAINAKRLWEMGYTGAGSKVLVIENSPCSVHPALTGNFLGNSVPLAHAWNSNADHTDCDPTPFIGSDSHANGVLGIAIGLDPNTNDTLGVAFNSKWMYGSYTIASFEWALDPDGNPNTTSDIPDVINASIYFGSKFNCSTSLQPLFESLEMADVSVIWAAGNSGPNTQSIPYPQNLVYSLVDPFAVGQVYHTQVLAGARWPLHPGSSLGPSRCGGVGSYNIKPEVVAPAPGILTADGVGYQVTGNGTSFAAPHVAGAILLLREAYPNATAQELKSALYYTARDLGLVGEDNSYGMGIIDVFAAYLYLSMNCAEGITVLQFPISGSANITNTSRVLGISAINPGANVTVMGGVDINLKEGFHAKAGSNFHAEIGGCSSSTVIEEDSETRSGNREIETQAVLENVTIANIFPNPANDVLKIELSDADKVRSYALMIIDMNGKILFYRDQITDAEMEIDISSWPSANYIGKIHTRDNQTMDFSFIKI